MDRTKFLEIYNELNMWLTVKGFTHSPPRGNPSLYMYSHYENYITPLYGVEAYDHSILTSIAFMRDKNEHKLMFVNKGNFSDILSITSFKLEIDKMFKEKELELEQQLQKLSHMIKGD